MRALLLIALLSLAGCATGPQLTRPSCGASCCLAQYDDHGDLSPSVACDGEVVDDAELGRACRRPDGVIEACGG